MGELQLTTLEYLNFKKILHKFYTIKRAFEGAARGGKCEPPRTAEAAHAAIVPGPDCGPAGDLCKN